MTAALKNIAVLSADKKTAILGDMFELGLESHEQHELIAKQANESGVDQLIFIGKDFYSFKDNFKGIFFESPAEATAYLQENPVQDHLVLLKGSRGMKLERLLQYL